MANDSQTTTEHVKTNGTHAEGSVSEAQHIHETTAHEEHQGSHGNVPPEKVFDHLLGELGDHHQLNIGFTTFDVLPIMIYDENGFHAYTNAHAMEEDGSYILLHSEEKALGGYNGHPVKADHGTVILVDGKPVKPMLDLSVTNYVALEWIGMAFLLFAFITSARRYKKSPLAAPKGIQNILELLVVYIRDEVVRPNVGTKRVTNQLMPYFVGLFFFILMLNFMGLIPGMHTVTSAIGVTAALAITAFVIINYISLKEAGLRAWFHHLLGGAPWFLAPIMVPIEVIGLFTKPFALTIRLFANMTAGHVVLLSLVGLIFYFQTVFVAPVSVGFSVFIYFIESLVCLLQAYIFTILTAVFIGLAIGDHKHEEVGAHH